MPVSPYQDLYIYYLSGHLPVCDQLGADFIGNWQEEDSSFLFFSSPAKHRVKTLIADHPDLILEDEYQMAYNDWQGGQMNPLTVGRFRITPFWMQQGKARPDLKQLNIILDPGVVFGNGLHPTTQNCLAALEQVWKERTFASVLDLGTGTGILALAAAHLGAQQVLAVDRNLLAVQTAETNRHRNRLQKQVLAIQGKAEEFIAHSADLLIANLHYEVMKKVVAAPGFLLKPWTILSGLLPSEARIISDQILKQGATVVNSWVHENRWHTFLTRSG